MILSSGQFGDCRYCTIRSVRYAKIGVDATPRRNRKGCARIQATSYVDIGLGRNGWSPLVHKPMRCRPMELPGLSPSAYTHLMAPKPTGRFDSLRITAYLGRVGLIENYQFLKILLLIAIRGDSGNSGPVRLMYWYILTTF